MRLKYHEIMRAEQKPDVYAGKDCNTHKPRWIGSGSGDKEGPTDVGNRKGHIVLVPSAFPAGTRIAISVPCCPECDEDADSAYLGKCQCGFDWKQWADTEFS